MMFYQGTPKRRFKIGAPCKKPERPWVPLKPREYHQGGEDISKYPSLVTPYDKSKDPLFMTNGKYEGEMAEREAKAQAEIERKKTMVAPLFNKGGLQYIGDAPPEIIRNLGRKV